MKEYTLDGEKYYFNGKRWIDANGLAVPSGLLGRLNSVLLEDDDLVSKRDDELLQYAANVKEGENYSLAIKAMEILIDRADANIVKSVLPRLTSCYRKMGRIEEAINLAEEYIASPVANVKSSALFTSLGAAYCDVEEYGKARECANRAYAMSATYASPELSSLYGRINKYDEIYTSPAAKKQVKKEDTSVSREKNNPVEVLLEKEKIEFSESLERVAMNRIWKAIPVADRAKYYDDFEIVCKGLKEGTLTSLEK